MPPRRTDSATELELLGRALGVLRKRANLSQALAAERVGITPQAWQRYEAGERQVLMRVDRQELYTAALGFTRGDLYAALERVRDEGEERPSASVHAFPSPSFAHLRWNGLPIRDQVQAGAWLAADDLNQAPEKEFAAARDPRFPKADQWISLVFGDSMNAAQIFEGDAAQFVDAVQIRYQPRSGDVVEVERTRFGGQLRELTIKQVEIDAAGRVTLWPRSTNPRWQEPLELKAEVAESEDFEVRIRGLLLATIRRF